MQTQGNNFTRLGDGSQPHGRASAMWRRCLASAFRTMLACTIVWVATLFGPEFITHQVAFPAFSYLTAILIVNNASLGDTLHGCWLALYATMQGVCPAILALWLIRPARFALGTTAAAVAMSAFVVALPGNTHLISKRISFGQVVLVYVIGYIRGVDADPVMHPLHVVASTALGAIACVLALLLPYPSLACYEVRENRKLYIENAAERLKLFIKAFTAEDKTLPKGLISQAKSLNDSGNKLLQSIKSKQESIKWERILVRFLKSYNQKNPEETLQGIETFLRAIETAVEECTEFPVGILNYELKNDLISLQEEVLNQVKSIGLGNSIHPQSEDTYNDKKFFQTFDTKTFPITDCKALPSLFFLFCLKHLHSKPESVISPDAPSKQVPHDLQDKKCWLSSMTWNNIITNIKVEKRQLMLALKCALSLGFAVLFGMTYDKENGYWSGLPVAVSLASAREATFKGANVRAQGTVIGSVYGAIGFLIFKKYVKLRFISLFPWFIFCSFLRQSRMYGQAGGICAIIGAVLILGRENFGVPNDFAITRIVETFIGLLCLILVDVLLQPTRAAVLAKLQVSMCLHTLHECIASVNLSASSKCSLEDRIKKLKFQTNELEELIEEAEAEPNFCFLPLNAACYGALKSSLTKTVDLLHFTSLALNHLKQAELNSITISAVDLNSFKEAVCCAIKTLEEVILVKSLSTLERVYEKRKTCVDLEMGQSGKPDMIQWSGLLDGGMNLDELEGGQEELMVILGAVFFCVKGVWKETKELEKRVRELVQWENPSMQVDLHEILRKLHVLNKNVDV